jgi:hypothetical protein
MVWLLPHHLPSFPVRRLSLFHSILVCHQSSLLTGEEGEKRGGGGAKSYGDEEAWSSIIIQYSLVIYKEPQRVYAFGWLCVCVSLWKLES